MGSVRVGQGSVISGDVVSVGGTTEIAEGAKIGGRTEIVDIPGGLPRIDWLRDWFRHCLLLLRPMAPSVGSVWVLWGVLFLIYLLIAAAFPRPTRACVDELTRRPATSFLMGILTTLLLPLVLLLLVVIVVGIVAVPFVIAALFLGLLVGKVAILEWLGFKIGAHFGTSGVQKPLVAFIMGVIIVTVLYQIPIIGMLTLADAARLLGLNRRIEAMRSRLP